MLIAALIYLVAFLFFSWDAASQSIRKLEAELQSEKAKELVGAGGPSVTERTPAPQLVSDDMEYTDSIKRPAANIGVAIMTIATLAHAFAVVARTVAASRAPWGNLYEFMTSGPGHRDCLPGVSIAQGPALRRNRLRCGPTDDDCRNHWLPNAVGNVTALQSWWLITPRLGGRNCHRNFAHLAMSVLQLIKQRAEKAMRSPGSCAWYRRRWR